MRQCQADITIATGRRGTQQFKGLKVEQYTTAQSIDNDADSFSIQLDDPHSGLALSLDRDNEVQVQLYLDDVNNRLMPIFNGIADTAARGEDFTLSIEGRDSPSSLAVDSDALPGRWKHVNPQGFLRGRAGALGIKDTQIVRMSAITSLFTDGSEKEWGFWYRIARMRGMYMWTDNVGRLIIDKLGYSLTPTYWMGEPPRGQSTKGWLPVLSVNQTSGKQQRMHRIIFYGENAKKGKALVAQGTDTSIGAWKRKATSILQDPTAKNQAALKKSADDEVFESIVGSQEIELTIHDTGVFIQQNRMALVNLPEYGIDMESWFVVGVQRQGGPQGLVQIVRLREKGFALSKRIPDAPTLNKKDAASDKPIASIAAALAQIPGIKYADSFVRATNEFGVANGWDFATFLGVLLSMCDQETGGTFNNCIEGNGQLNWQPFDQWVNSGDRLSVTKSESELEREYMKLFANAAGNSLNPFGREAGVGPMQLTSIGYKRWADTYGWNGHAKESEYNGGRWNPDSNIRAAARALVEKLKVSPPADPTNPDSIWIGVARYNGSSVYADKVRAKFKAIYAGEASGAVAAVRSLPAGSTDTSVQIPGHGILALPDNTPKEVRKAINFALRRMGDPYRWGGAGPYYDCSSFVTAALASGAPYLRAMLDVPVPETHHHGDSTYTLWEKGLKPGKDNLLPGDLVFFRGVPPEHVGMYLDDGLFIHDPHTGDFVKVSSLNEDYYRERYVGARRLVTTWFQRAGGPR